MKKISDVMQPTNVVLRKTDSLSEAVSKITRTGLLGLPVVSEQDKELIGFVSEQDCLEHLMTESYHCDTHISVADIMRENPLHVSDDLTVLSLAQMMGRGKPKIFPVTQEGKLVGIVTRGNVIKALAESLDACSVF